MTQPAPPRCGRTLLHPRRMNILTKRGRNEHLLQADPSYREMQEKAVRRNSLRQRLTELREEIRSAFRTHLMKPVCSVMTCWNSLFRNVRRPGKSGSARSPNRCALGLIPSKWTAIWTVYSKQLWTARANQVAWDRPTNSVIGMRSKYPLFRSGIVFLDITELLSPCSLVERPDQPNQCVDDDAVPHVRLCPVQSLQIFVKPHGQRRGSILVSHNLDVRSSVALRRGLEGLIEIAACSDACRKPVVAS
jgi:hypothetical protein